MKMLVIDDHAIVRQGLAALLTGQGAATEVLQAGSTEEGLALVVAHADLDAVILDLQMPGGDGTEAIAAFGRARPTLPVIILSSSEEEADVRRALDLGALGYIHKSASPGTLISAVRLVLAGEVYVPPLMLKAEPAAALAPGLTARQADVLAGVALGLSNRQIGQMFGLSEKTVKVHVGAILRALGVANRTQAATAAQAAGLTPRPASGPPAPPAGPPSAG
jgi:DNA-binding NarL/FixJ family response regulator